VGQLRPDLFTRVGLAGKQECLAAEFLDRALADLLT
jgi:hypothetical protein